MTERGVERLLVEYVNTDSRVLQPVAAKSSSGSSVPRSHGVSSSRRPLRRAWENGVRGGVSPTKSTAGQSPGKETGPGVVGDRAACSSVRKNSGPSATQGTGPARTEAGGRRLGQPSRGQIG